MPLVSSSDLTLKFVKAKRMFVTFSTSRIVLEVGLQWKRLEKLGTIGNCQEKSGPVDGALDNNSLMNLFCNKATVLRIFRFKITIMYIYGPLFELKSIAHPKPNAFTDRRQNTNIRTAVILRVTVPITFTFTMRVSKLFTLQKACI